LDILFSLATLLTTYLSCTAVYEEREQLGHPT
jgi:hypothetical protein